MIEYRPFRNCDPPGIAEVWRSQPPQHGVAQPVSAQQFELAVLSKPYFDASGLLIAVESDRVVGFAHGGFGASDCGTRLDFELGSTCLLMVEQHSRRAEIAAELLSRCEDYLRSRGAKVLYCGELSPLNPFYLGLYGGSEMPGVLTTDETWLAAIGSGGYREIDRCQLFERDLAMFRPPVDRQQLQIRRQYGIEATFDPQAKSWWDACIYGDVDRTRFELRPRGVEEPVAAASFWDLEPLAASWGVSAVGLVGLETSPDHRRQGMATFLIGEALRQLHAHGVVRCQVAAMQRNNAAISLYQKLGFEQVGEGVVFRKE